MPRKIDTMPWDEIVCQLVRIAACAKHTYEINNALVMTSFRGRGEVALGRREICALLLDDLRVTFGIEV